MRRHNKGFTLIEVMVAAAIFGIGCLGVIGLMMTVVKHSNEAHMRTEAVTIAESKIAYLHSIGSASGCVGQTSWKSMDTKDIYKIYCREYSTTATTKPIAIRVVWGSDGSECSLSESSIDNLDTFNDSKSTGCEFVTLSYVPVNTTGT